MAGRDEAPKRIQRQRTKGWRMPENTVYVGRPTKWGNPFRRGVWIEHDSPLAPYVGIEDWAGLSRIRLSTAQQAVTAHWNWLMEYPPLMAALALGELRGKDLACWCPLDQPCHADVLLEWANS